MNKLVVIFLFSVFVFSILKPALPYLEYAVYKDYIVKVLCINKEKPKMKCNGKCHLKKQLKKANKESSPVNSLASKSLKQVVYLYQANSLKYKNPTTTLINEYVKLNYDLTETPLTGPPVPPPENSIA